MGLIVSVYKTAALGDCTGGGISSRHDELTVVNVDGPFAPNPDRPAVALLEGARGCPRIVPVLGDEDEGYQMVEPDGFVGPMMGGHYAGTSDSRFSKAVEEITGARFYGAVAIHDRYETGAQYRSYD